MKRRMLSSMSVLRTSTLAIVLLMAACGPPAINGGFDSANPAAKMYAIEYAARNGDRSAIPRIIEQLGSDDPGVRSLAISSLYRLTGQTYGYHDYDPPELRREAIARWIQADQSGELNIRSTASDDFKASNGPTDGANIQENGAPSAISHG